MLAVYPVPFLKGQPPKVSQGYGGSSGEHKGVDVMYRRASKGSLQLPVYSPWYFMPNGVPALSILPGTVTRSSMIGTGGRVRIDHGNGLESAYYHLFSTKVHVGQTVKAGQVLGNIYHNVIGYRLNHLHFEIFKNGRNVDPKPMLSKAKMIKNPNLGILLIAGVAVVGGLVASRYIL